MGHLDHDHTHDHTHSHDHDHLHSHEPLQAKDGAVDEQTVAVLRYMLDHNSATWRTSSPARPATRCSTPWSPSTRPTAICPPPWSCWRKKTRTE